jgi:autoinducer 2-degrading protein
MQMKAKSAARWIAIAAVGAALWALPGQQAVAQGAPPAGQGAPGGPPGQPPDISMVDIEVNPPDLQKFIAAVGELGEAAVKQPGVFEFNIMAPKDQPNHIILFELYENEAAHQAHLASADFKKFKAATASMIKSNKAREMMPIALNSAPPPAGGPPPGGPPPAGK